MVVVMMSAAEDNAADQRSGKTGQSGIRMQLHCKH